MRSRNEASFASMLDRLRWEWAYEVQTFCAPGGCYLPDFLINVPSGDGLYPVWVELKPTEEQAIEARSKMERILFTYPDALLATAIPSQAADPDVSYGTPFVFQANYLNHSQEPSEGRWWWGTEAGHDGRILGVKHWTLPQQNEIDTTRELLRDLGW